MKTTNYEIFENWTFNRELNGTNLSRIELNMNQNGFLEEEEIYVTDIDNDVYPHKHIILDGHHRKFIAQKLNIPIFYKIIQGVKTAEEIKKRILLYNTNRKDASWDDYLTMNLDNSNYKELHKLKIETGFSTSLLLQIYQTNLKKEAGQAKRLFANGHFKFSKAGIDKILKVYSVFLILKKVKKPNFNENPKKYIMGISSILSNPVVDINRLMDKIEAHPHLILPNTKAGCTRILYKIHNHAAKEADKISLPNNLV